MSRPLLKVLAAVLAGTIFFLAFWVGTLTQRRTRGIAELERVLAPHLESRHSELGGGAGNAFFERYYEYVVKLPPKEARDILEQQLRQQGWTFDAAPVNEFYVGRKATSSGFLFHAVITPASTDRKTSSIMVIDQGTHYSPLEAKVLSLIGLG